MCVLIAPFLLLSLGHAQIKPTENELTQCVELTRQIIAAARQSGFDAIKPYCALPDGAEADYPFADKQRVKVLRQFADSVRSYQLRCDQDDRLKGSDHLFASVAIGRPELSGTTKDPYPEQRLSPLDWATVWTFTFPIRLGSDAWQEQQQGFRRCRWFLFFEPRGRTVRLTGCNGYLVT